MESLTEEIHLLEAVSRLVQRGPCIKVFQMSRSGRNYRISHRRSSSFFAGYLFKPYRRCLVQYLNFFRLFSYVIKWFENDDENWGKLLCSCHKIKLKQDIYHQTVNLIESIINVVC